MPLLVAVLGFLARRILARHRPRVIAITGSVGKTSARDAIFCVVQKAFVARRSESNYNNEIGVPLTVIGAASPGRNVFGWCAVFCRAAGAYFDRSYPNVLIVECGADKPGDIEYLARMLQPEVGIVTAIGAVHTEQLKSVEGVAYEKAKLIERLPPNGCAILNTDDDRVRALASSTKARVVTYGIDYSADLTANDVHLTEREGAIGLALKVRYRGNTVPLFSPGTVARQQAYALLAACAVGSVLGMNLADIASALREYEPPRGRTRIIPGMNGSLILDDTYNASPLASKPALELLCELGRHMQRRTTAVLGDMLELGDYTEAAHEEVGEYVVRSGIDTLVTVGTHAEKISAAATARGMRQASVVHCESQGEVIQYLKEHLGNGDIVLVKGSQGARMERIVKGIMANPQDAEKLLVRQSRRWLAKK